MKIKELFLKSINHKKPKTLVFIFIFIFFCGVFYPSDMDGFYAVDRSQNVPTYVEYTEEYARFIPTIIQAILPILTRDPVGLMQTINVGILTTLSTHSIKYALDDVVIFGRRLGQRPRAKTSHHNMPSGHSSMVGCAVAFLARRYGLKWLFLLPIAFLTMYARFLYDAHTISATIAGLSLGIICSLLLSSRYEKKA